MSNGSERIAEYPGGTDLDGATERGPDNAYPATSGAFAARWNEWTEEQRGKWLERAVRASQESMTCFQMLHEGRLEQAERENAALRGQLAAAEAVIHRIEESAAKPFGWLEYGEAVDAIIREYRSEGGARG